MNDENDRLLDRLFEAARSVRPDTAAIEEHFETRLLGRMEEEQRSSQGSWSAWAWRLLPWFATIAVIVGIGSIACDPARSGDLFATLTGGYDEYLTASLLAGG